jgi:branched-chain amino acid transport system permease protein
MQAVMLAWSAWLLMLGGAALNAIFAYGLYATSATGRPNLVALASGAVAGLLGAGLAQAGVPLPLAAVAGLIAGPALALGFGGATRHLPPGRALLASLALLLAIAALASHVPGLPAVLPGPPLPVWLLPPAALLLGLGFRALHHSWHGRAALVLRHDASLAASIGIPADTTQRVGLIAAGLAGALGGLLLAFCAGAASGGSFGLPLVFAAVAALVLGGVEHWTGPLFGAAAVLLLGQIGQIAAPELDVLPTGLAVVLVLLFRPGGLTAPMAPPRRRSARPRNPRPPQRVRYHRVDR